MFKVKPPLPIRTAKKMAKEITHNRNGETIVFADQAPIPPPRKELKKPKISQKNKELVLKTIHKGTGKHSKRTSHREHLDGSVPAHVHPEGKRWVQNLAKQSVVKNRSFAKKMAKNKR